MDETNTQMRRSTSMPVKPMQLEEKTLKRSEEKETVYATDDSDGYDNSNDNYLRQRSSPAIVTDNSAEPIILRGLPKPIRLVRDFLANAVNLIFSIFRKSNKNTNTKNVGDNVQESSSISTTERNGECCNLNIESNRSCEQNSKKLEDLEKNIDSPKERVVFSLQ